LGQYFFGSGAYRRNAMLSHLELHLKNKIKDHLFNSWLKLFNQSVDKNFAGKNAGTAKFIAKSMAGVINFKTKQL
jgi:truncated hemoglobin YjbI